MDKHNGKYKLSAKIKKIDLRYKDKKIVLRYKDKKILLAARKINEKDKQLSAETVKQVDKYKMDKLSGQTDLAEK